MAINLIKAGTALGVGVVDTILKKQDDTARRAEWKRWSAIARIGFVAGGYGLAALGPRNMQEYGETVAIAATPLLVHELAKMLDKPTAKEYTFSPRMVASGGSARDYAPSTPGRSTYRPLR